MRRAPLLLAAARPGAVASRRDVRLRYAAAACIFLAALAYGGGARVTLGLTAAAAISAGARAGRRLCAAPRRWLGGSAAATSPSHAWHSPSRRSRSRTAPFGWRSPPSARSWQGARRRRSPSLPRSRSPPASPHGPEPRRAPRRVRGCEEMERRRAAPRLPPAAHAPARRRASHAVDRRLRRKLRPPFLVALAAALTADDFARRRGASFCAWLGHYFAQ